jgi:hypothetical protein
METNRPMASLIGFDANLGSANVNRGRRSTDPGNQRFAEVYDLAAYAASGSRDAARVKPTSTLSPVTSGTTTATLTVAAPAALDPASQAAADRLFLHLTGGWDATSSSRAPVVMRLQDASGTQLAQRVVPAPHDDGPEVA